MKYTVHYHIKLFFYLMSTYQMSLGKLTKKVIIYQTEILRSKSDFYCVFSLNEMSEKIHKSIFESQLKCRM